MQSTINNDQPETETEAERITAEILAEIKKKQAEGIKILMLTPWFGLKAAGSKHYANVIRRLKTEGVEFYEEKHGINILNHPYVATVSIPEGEQKEQKELTIKISDTEVSFDNFFGGREQEPVPEVTKAAPAEQAMSAPPELARKAEDKPAGETTCLLSESAIYKAEVQHLLGAIDNFFGVRQEEPVPEVTKVAPEEQGMSAPPELVRKVEDKPVGKKTKSKADQVERSTINRAEFEDLLDDTREHEIQEIKSTLQLLEKVDAIVESDWDGQHENLKKHARKIATLYARMQNLRVDAEAGLTSRTYKFLATGQGKDLKQYEYKDRLANYVLWEQKLLSKIDGLLKSMSKQADIILTLISTSKTEMSLAINNLGGQA